MHHLLNNGEGIGISQRPMNRAGTQHAQFRAAFWQDHGENDNDAGDGPDGYDLGPATHQWDSLRRPP